MTTTAITFDMFDVSDLIGRFLSRMKGAWQRGMISEPHLQRLRSWGDSLAAELGRRGKNKTVLLLRRFLHALPVRDQYFGIATIPIRGQQVQATWHYLRSAKQSHTLWNKLLPRLEALADTLSSRERSAADCGEQQHVDAPLAVEGPPLRSPGRPRMTVEDANRKALDLATKDRYWVRRTQRQWADDLGCSVGLVARLPLWVATMAKSGRGRSGHSSTPRVVSFTKPVEESLGRDDDPLQQLIEEQAADDRRRKIGSRERV